MMEEQEPDPAQEEEGVHQEEEWGLPEEGHLDEEVVAVVEAGEGAITKEVKVEEGQQENSSSAAPHSSEDPIPTHSEFESQQPEVTIDIESLG